MALVASACAGSSPTTEDPNGQDPNGQNVTSVQDGGGGGPTREAGSADAGSGAFGGNDAAVTPICTVGQTRPCASPDAGASACLTGTQTCERPSTTGDMTPAQWGACVGWTPCDGGSDASAADAGSCTFGELQWTCPFDGYPKSFTPTLAPNEKIVGVDALSGTICVDAEGNCMPCQNWGTIAADGKSFYMPFGDFDNDNSGACFFTFRTETCP